MRALPNLRAIWAVGCSLLDDGSGAGCSLAGGVAVNMHDLTALQAFPMNRTVSRSPSRELSFQRSIGNSQLPHRSIDRLTCTDLR